MCRLLCERMRKAQSDREMQLKALKGVTVVGYRNKPHVESMEQVRSDRPVLSSIPTKLM